MARGGPRPGSGKPKGYKHQKTREKEADAELFRAWLRKRRLPIWQAQYQRAIGDYVLYVPTETGMTRVTDQQRMDQILSLPQKVAGRDYWLIAKRDPEPSLLRELNNRLFGTAPQAHELTGPAGSAIPMTIIHEYHE